MGNQCDTYFLHQPTLNLPPRSLTRVSNAPSNNYALRLKNKFPKLQAHIEQIRNKIKMPGVDEIIRQCPIYFIYEKSAVYQGQWDNGQPHGYGRVIYSDFSYYEGLFKNSEPCTFITPQHHQDSIYIFADGTYYRGDFANSKFQGKGVLVKEESMKISGNFKQGLPHGQVIQTLLYLNEFGDLVQSTYEGEFIDGVKQGKGRLQDAKFLYVGDFQNGLPHGFGQLIDYNGIEFKGKFHNGKIINGQLKSSYGIIRGYQPQKKCVQDGYYEWKEGKKFYIGGIKGDKLHGTGKIHFDGGRVIQGVWKNGHSHHVTRVEQISESQVMKIRKEHQKQFAEVDEENQMGSRSENRSVESGYHAEERRSEYNLNNQLRGQQINLEPQLSLNKEDRVLEMN